jgi:hypothetical protein
VDLTLQLTCIELSSPPLEAKVAVFLGFFSSLFVYVILCYMGYCLPLKKTFVIGFVFVSLSSVI